MKQLALLGITLGSLALLLTGCGSPESNARKELEGKGYELAARGMILAAGAGDVESIRLYREAGFEIDSVDSKGNTPLIRASGSGHLAAVEAILGMGADPRHTNKVGRDALLSASAKGFADVARMLVSRGSDLTVRDEEGWSALSIAAYNGHSEVVSMLASQVEPNDLDDALLVASFSGDAGVISSLLGHGANINARSPENKTPLMIAAEGGKKEAARVLLQNMANPYSEDEEGATAAMLAESAGFDEVKDLILSPDDWGVSEESLEVRKEMAMARQALSAEGAIEETLAEAPVADSEGGPEGLASSGDENILASNATETEPEKSNRPEAGDHSSAPPSSNIESRDRVVSAGGAVTGPRKEISAVSDPKRVRDESRSKPVVALNGSTIRSTTPREAPVRSMMLSAFHEEPLPIAVSGVDGERAEFRRLDREERDAVEVEPGQVIPGTVYEVQEVTRKFVSSKEGKGRMVDVSRVKVRNRDSGSTHLLVKDVAGRSSDTYAILTAPNSRYRYVVKTGDKFRTSQPGTGEKDYQVLDIRAEGVIVKDLATDEVLTIARDGVVSF